MIEHKGNTKTGKRVRTMCARVHAIALGPTFLRDFSPGMCHSAQIPTAQETDETGERDSGAETRFGSGGEEQKCRKKKKNPEQSGI